VAFGVGAAGLAGTVIAAVIRQSALDEIRKDPNCSNRGDGGWACPGEQQTLQPTIDRGKTATTLFNVMLPVTIVGAATGAVLLLTSRPRSPQTALVVSPSGAWAVGRF
jgi:hypothetical protein